MSNGRKRPFRWDKISLFAGARFRQFIPKISSSGVQLPVWRKLIPGISGSCLAEHHHTLAWFFLEFFFLGKLKFYSQKTVINRINFQGWFCKTGRKNFHNNIKKLNLRKGLSNDISGFEIHHSYPKKSPKKQGKCSLFNQDITNLWYKVIIFLLKVSFDVEY